MLTQLRHKTAWMYAVEQPARPADSWAEHGAIVDAVARGDADRARALTAQHAERAIAEYRLRRPGRPAAAVSRPGRVRTSQHAVNTPSGRH